MPRQCSVTAAAWCESTVQREPLVSLDTCESIGASTADRPAAAAAAAAAAGV
jgi:hypothetical protein